MLFWFDWGKWTEAHRSPKQPSATYWVGRLLFYEARIVSEDSFLNNWLLVWVNYYNKTDLHPEKKKAKSHLVHFWKNSLKMQNQSKVNLNVIWLFNEDTHWQNFVLLSGTSGRDEAQSLLALWPQFFIQKLREKIVKAVSRGTLHLIIYLMSNYQQPIGW